MESAAKKPKKEDELTAEKLQSLKETIFNAAMEGNAEEIKAVLSGLPDEIVKEVLHHHSSTATTEKTFSPLTVAIISHNACVARLLVKVFRVDIEQSTTLDCHGHKYKTALLTAIQIRQLEIVKILVENGADVNEVSDHPRTIPLHEACSTGVVMMVQYLVDKGARTDVLDQQKYTCLMAACRPGNEDTVHFLLKKGMDPNQSWNRWTALHVAALRDAGAIGEILLAHGAVMTKDFNGNTPLTYAIIYDRANFVGMVLHSNLTSREEKIRALELRAAFCVPDHTNDSIQYLKEALIERHRDPSCVLLKPHRPPEPALGNVLESQTMEELLARERDPTALMFKCLLIAERILGPVDENTAYLYMKLCRYLKSLSRVSEAIALYLYGRRVSKFHKRSNRVDTEIINIFKDALHNGSPLPFADVVSVLKLVMEEEEEMLNLRPKDGDFQLLGYSRAYFTFDLFKVALDMVQSREHESQLQDLVRCFQIVIPSLVLQSLLHLAIESLGNHPYMHEDTSASWVSFVAVLLKCGCDPDALDHNRNMPLHLIATLPLFQESLDAACQITRLPLEAGAHVDIHNDDGRTPMDVMRSTEVHSILREYYPLSLKCLAALAVIEHGISYDDRVPNSVKKFIKLHTPRR